jgi:hypothetical protein
VIDIDVATNAIWDDEDAIAAMAEAGLQNIEQLALALCDELAALRTAAKEVAANVVESDPPMSRFVLLRRDEWLELKLVLEDE